MVSYAIVLSPWTGAVRRRRPARRASPGAIVPDLPVEEVGRAGQDLPRGRFQPDPARHADHAARAGRADRRKLDRVSLLRLGRRHHRRADRNCRRSLVDNVGWLREQTTLPICIGFGISTPEHVKQLAPVADGLIVGSAIVRRIAEADQKPRDAGAQRSRRVRGQPDRGARVRCRREKPSPLVGEGGFRSKPGEGRTQNSRSGRGNTRATSPSPRPSPGGRGRMRATPSRCRRAGGG